MKTIINVRKIRSIRLFFTRQKRVKNEFLILRESSLLYDSSLLFYVNLLSYNSIGTKEEKEEEEDIFLKLLSEARFDNFFDDIFYLMINKGSIRAKCFIVYFIRLWPTVTACPKSKFYNKHYLLQRSLDSYLRGCSINSFNYELLIEIYFEAVINNIITEDDPFRFMRMLESIDHQSINLHFQRLSAIYFKNRKYLQHHHPKLIIDFLNIEENHELDQLFIALHKCVLKGNYPLLQDNTIHIQYLAISHGDLFPLFHKYYNRFLEFVQISKLKQSSLFVLLLTTVGLENSAAREVENNIFDILSTNELISNNFPSDELLIVLLAMRRHKALIQNGYLDESTYKLLQSIKKVLLINPQQFSLSIQIRISYELAYKLKCLNFDEWITVKRSIWPYILKNINKLKTFDLISLAFLFKRFISLSKPVHVEDWNFLLTELKNRKSFLSQLEIYRIFQFFDNSLEIIAFRRGELFIRLQKLLLKAYDFFKMK